MMEIRSKESDCKKRIKEKIYNIIEDKYSDIILSQQKSYNPINYKPLLTKFFQKEKNINSLLNELIDLKCEYENFETKINFKEYVQSILHSIEMSKIGYNLDKKITEHIKSYKDFMSN